MPRFLMPHNLVMMSLKIVASYETEWVSLREDSLNCMQVMHDAIKLQIPGAGFHIHNSC